MKEHDIEQVLVNAVRSHGGLAWKFTSPGTAGVPDRIVLMPGGQIAFVELKAPGKKPRSLQLLRMRQLKKLGFRSYVIDDPEQIPLFLKEVMPGEVHST